MKKLLTLLLVLCSLLFFAVGCSEQTPEHAHTFNQKTVSSQYLASQATCIEKDKYYFSCECGEKGTEIFENSLGVHNLDENGYCNICEQQISSTQGITYELSEDETYAIVTGYEGTETNLVISAEYQSVPVKSIKDCAFLDTNLESVSIPAGLTHIGNAAFMNCVNLINATIPTKIVHIGYLAFYNTSITNAIMGNDIRFIGDSAFNSITTLENISIGDNIEYIGNGAFYNSTKLETIEIGKNIGYIGNYAFENCPIKKATIPARAISSVPKNYLETVEIIGNTDIESYAFENAEKLTNVIIGDDIAYLGTKSFSGCTNLKEIYLSKNLVKIGNYAFENCSSLTSIIMSENLNAIGYYAFVNCNSLINIQIPNSTTVIGEYAFYYCTSLASIEIPDSVTSLGSNMFEGCTSLESVIIGNGITCIGYETFRACSSLTNIEIPNSVRFIGNHAFQGCTGLTKIFLHDDINFVQSNVFYDCMPLTIYCEVENKPNSWYDDWNVSNCPVVWDCNNNDIATDGCVYTVIDGIRYSIKDGKATVVRQSRLLKTVNIPSTITYKGNNYSVTSIGEYAFYGCTSLISATIPDSIISIERAAFKFCSSLTSIILLKNVTSIGYDIFYNCSLLETIYCEAESKPSGWHNNWNYLCSAKVIWGYEKEKPATEGLVFTSTNNNTAYSVTGYTGTSTEVYIPSTYNNLPVTSIGNAAFYNCNSLKSVTIGNNVTSIEPGAFSDCSSLIKVTIGDSVKTIGEQAFYNCSSLSSITIGKSVTTIDAWAFHNCTSLESIEIPSSVTTIKEQAFYNCTSLRSIIIPDTVTYIGLGIFRDCSSSLTVYFESKTGPNAHLDWKYGFSGNVVWGYDGN